MGVTLLLEQLVQLSALLPVAELLLVLPRTGAHSTWPRRKDRYNHMPHWAYSNWFHACTFYSTQLLFTVHNSFCSSRVIARIQIIRHPVAGRDLFHLRKIIFIRRFEWHKIILWLHRS